MLDEFVVVGGVFGDEVAGLQVVVDAQAGPRVDGGIGLLGIGEVGGFPVRELLAFADLFLEEDGVDLLQAHVGDVILLDKLLEFDEAYWLEVTHACQLMEIVGCRQSYLGDALILEE